MFNKYFTTGELAKILGVSKATLERNRWQGIGIPFVKFGRRTVRYRDVDVKTWLDSTTRINTTNNGGSYER